MQDYLKELEEEGQVTCEEFKSYFGHFCETCTGFNGVFHFFHLFITWIGSA
jgi:hypothetical protein